MYNGHLLANVFMKKHIVEINIDTGDVLHKYNMQALYDDVEKIEPNVTGDWDNCLNGIAYNQ